MHTSVRQFIEIEKKNKLDQYTTYQKFAKKVEDTKMQSLKLIENIKSDGKTVIGYGAPAKATTILNYFGITDKEIEFTIDDNLLKHNKFIPETNIQIKQVNDIEPDNYNYVLVLAWNFFESIKKNKSKIFKNSKFIKLK